MWGPPGVGKTTIARLIGNKDSSAYREVSAIYSTISELKKIFADAKAANSQSHSSTLLFVDEIHRFNKAQQDAFLPVIENGTIILIGSTTENPSFALNSALLQDCLLLFSISQIEVT